MSGGGVSNRRERRRVGLLVPSTDTTVEVDLYRNLPSFLTVHAARMFLAGVTVADEERMLAEELPRAAREVKSLAPDVVAFACTSAGALRGPQGDREIAVSIERVVGRPVVTVFGSALETLRVLAPRRLLVFTPYVQEVNDRMKAALAAGGVPPRAVWGWGLATDLEIGRLAPDSILATLREKVRETRPDCVFLSCTNLRAWEILSAARQELGIPVLSSNFLMYRSLLRALGCPVPDLEKPVWGVSDPTCGSEG